MTDAPAASDAKELISRAIRKTRAGDAGPRATLGSIARVEFRWAFAVAGAL